VYSEPHPLMDAQAAWLAAYERSLEGSELDDVEPDDEAVGV